MLLYRLLGFVFLAIIIMIVVGVPYLFLFGGAERFLQKPLRRRYDGLNLRDVPEAGDVEATYHTYRGFLLWFTQNEHHVFGPPSEVRTFLRRMRNWNLSWGLLSYGVLFIPFLAIANYSAQIRSIEKQEIGGEDPESIESPTTLASQSADRDGVTDVSVSTVETPSAFHRFVGWIAAILCVCFATSVVVSVFNSDFSTAAGGGFVAVLLGSVAREWLGKRPAT